MSHARAVATVQRSLKSILMSLDYEATERGNPSALGLATLMKMYEFVAALEMMGDLLPHLARLSLMFQRASIDLSLISPMVESAIALVECQLAESDQMYDRVEAKIQELRNSDLSVNVPTLPARHRFDSTVRRPYLTSVINHLQNRFPCNQILDAFSILDPKLLPQDDEELLSYGDDQVGAPSAALQ